MDYRQSLKELLQRKSLFRGTFKLTSGRTSDYYLDCKLTTLDPMGAVLTGHAILEVLESEGIKADAIGGPTIGADPIVAAVAAMSYLRNKPIPAFLVRKDRKAHGRQRQIEGVDLPPGAKVVVIDEVCTTGESTMEAIRAAREAQLEIVAVLSLVDREEGGSERLRREYRYIPVFTARELLESDVQATREPREASKDSPRTAELDSRSA